MKADITMTRKQAYSVVTAIAVTLDSVKVPRKDAKRLMEVVDNLDFAFEMGLCEDCGLPEESQT